MITDAKWADFDNDNDYDLIIVGEWMGIKLFENDNSNFNEISKDVGLKNTSGWWNRIITSDIDNDGDIDYILGNHGLNSRFKASLGEPISCYINDFDNNGSIEQIVCNYNQGESFPLVLRHDLIEQLPHLKKKYVNYSQYKGQTIKDLFTEKELEGSIVHEVTMLESVILLNNGEGFFNIKPLPKESQFSPIYAIIASDFDKDGNIDLILGGNLYNVKPEIGRYDASYGQFLKGLGNGNFIVFIITLGTELSSGNFLIVPSTSIGTSTSPTPNTFLFILIRFFASLVSVKITGYFEIIFKNISSPPSLSLCTKTTFKKTKAAPF